MSFTVPLPPNFDVFQRVIKENAPQMPLAPVRPDEEERRRARQIHGVITTILSGAGVSVPTEFSMFNPEAQDVSEVLDLPSSAEEVAEEYGANAATTALENWGGPAAAGVIQLVQGAYQELTRVDAMVEYLLSIEGYMSTLARTALLSTTIATAPRLPDTVVPARRQVLQGRMTNRQRSAYGHGRSSVTKAFDILERRLPREAGEAHPTTRCLIAIADQAGHLVAGAQNNPRALIDTNEVVEGKLLEIDLMQHRERLARWCRER